MLGETETLNNEWERDLSSMQLHRVSPLSPFLCGFGFATVGLQLKCSVEEERSIEKLKLRKSSLQDHGTFLALSAPCLPLMSMQHCQLESLSSRCALIWQRSAMSGTGRSISVSLRQRSVMFGTGSLNMIAHLQTDDQCISFGLCSSSSSATQRGSMPISATVTRTPSGSG